MPSNSSAIGQATQIVASKIDELESGFPQVRDQLGGLRSRSVEFIQSVMREPSRRKPA